MARQGRRLMQPPQRAVTLPLAVAWVGLCGGWYSMVLFLPAFFQRRSSGATSGLSFYAETFAVAAANLPGNLLSLMLVDRLGRRLTACASMAGACLAALAFAAAPATGLVPLAAACVFNGVSVAAWNALDLASTELFPTARGVGVIWALWRGRCRRRAFADLPPARLLSSPPAPQEVRATGMGLLGAGGRASALVFTHVAGSLMDWALWAPLVLAAALLAVGAAAMLACPETAGEALCDSMGERRAGGYELVGGSELAAADRLPFLRSSAEAGRRPERPDNKA